LNKAPGLRWELVRQFETLFAARRPDVVHTHQIGGLIYAGIFAMATFIDPKQREISVPIPQDRFYKQQR